MRLIVDTNRIIAALIKNSASRKILLSAEAGFLTVGLTSQEISEHKSEILSKAGITEKELEKLFSLIFSKVLVVDDVAIKSKFDEATGIMDKIDPADTPFIALALAVDNEGIWSDDKHFERQNKIRIWKTKELLKLISV